MFFPLVKKENIAVFRTIYFCRGAKNYTKSKEKNISWKDLIKHKRRIKDKSDKIVTVQLLQNIPMLGSKGQIVKVKSARMRNDLHIGSKAAYIIPDKLTPPLSLLTKAQEKSAIGRAKREKSEYTKKLKNLQFERSQNIALPEIDFSAFESTVKSNNKLLEESSTEKNDNNTETNNKKTNEINNSEVDGVKQFFFTGTNETSSDNSKPIALNTGLNTYGDKKVKGKKQPESSSKLWNFIRNSVPEKIIYYTKEEILDGNGINKEDIGNRITILSGEGIPSDYLRILTEEKNAAGTPVGRITETGTYRLLIKIPGLTAVRRELIIALEGDSSMLELHSNDN